jgi:hypothetical protein
MTTIGPAAYFIIAFLGAIGSVTSIYVAQILACRLSGGRNCAETGRGD